MSKKKDPTKIIIWIIIVVLAFLILNGNIDLGLFSVESNIPETTVRAFSGGGRL